MLASLALNRHLERIAPEICLLTGLGVVDGISVLRRSLKCLDTDFPAGSG